MLYQIVYLIKPSETLMRRFPNRDSDIASILLAPTIWTKSQSDRSSWTSEDHVVQIKLLFLAYLKQEYSAYVEYEQLLGDSQLCIDTFDAWWMVESYLVDDKVEEVEKSIRNGVAQCIVCTNRPNIDNWISSLCSGGNPDKSV